MKRGKLALVLPLLAFAGIAVLALGVATGSARSHKQAAAFKAITSVRDKAGNAIAMGLMTSSSPAR